MRIELDEDCTVARATALKERFLEALRRGEAAEVSLRGVAQADLSFFELLHAVRHGFERRGVGLVLLPDLPGHLARAAGWTGLAELCPGGAAAAKEVTR